MGVIGGVEICLRIWGLGFRVLLGLLLSIVYPGILFDCCFSATYGNMFCSRLWGLRLLGVWGILRLGGLGFSGFGVQGLGFPFLEDFSGFGVWGMLDFGVLGFPVRVWGI